jgi:hypothetical protein
MPLVLALCPLAGIPAYQLWLRNFKERQPLHGKEGGQKHAERGASIVVLEQGAARQAGRHVLPSAETKNAGAGEQETAWEWGLSGVADSLATVHKCNGRRWLRGKQEQQKGEGAGKQGEGRDIRQARSGGRGECMPGIQRDLGADKS